MKISKAINFIVCLITVAGLVGCKKKLAEVNPSGTTAEAVYTTPEGFETLVNGAYSYNRWWYGKEDGFGASEFGTDLWTIGQQGATASSGLAGENKYLILYQNLVSANLNVTRLWKHLYAAVNLCNEGISVVESGKLNASDAQIKQRVAEVYFLRAWYYWHIVEQWGGVHFTTEPTHSLITTANRTPVSTFYDQIIADLNIAVNDLSTTSSDYGRVNKNVAKAFLARVYLTRGYYTKDNADFTQARDLALDVINTGGYSLLSNYEDLWNMNFQKNKEVIWAITYSTDINNSDVYNADTNPYGYGDDILSAGGNPTNNRGNDNAHTLFIPGYDCSFTPAAWFDGVKPVKRDVRNGWPFIRAMPTKYLLNLFNGAIDSRYHGSFQTVWKVNYNVTSGRLVGKIPYVDTALVIDKNPTPNPNYYTFSVDSNYNPDGSTVFGNNLLFPALIKFKDSTRSASPNDYGSGNIQSAKDIFAIRLAEMYMIAAEAAFQLGDASSAASYINVLRTRAAVKTPVDQTAAMQVSAGDITLDFILDERAREFAGEQIRWFDLKRTGKLVSRVQAYNPDAGAYIQSYNTVRPIPQQQMDAVTNKGEFTQNPGY